jgi:hypothetical protein
VLICVLAAILVGAKAVLWLPVMDGGPEHTSEEAAMKNTKRARTITPSEAGVVNVMPNMTPRVCSRGLGIRSKDVGERVRGRVAMAAPGLQGVWVRGNVGVMDMGEPSSRPILHWHADNGQSLKVKPGRGRSIPLPSRSCSAIRFPPGPFLHDSPHLACLSSTQTSLRRGDHTPVVFPYGWPAGDTSTVSGVKLPQLQVPQALGRSRHR